MARVERFDVCANVGSPFCDHGSGTRVTTGFIRQLPGKDCRGRFVAIDDQADVCFISFLRAIIGVPGGMIAAESGRVIIYTTYTIPVVY